MDNMQNDDKNKLVLEARHASWLIAGLLFLGVLIFISGYMVGKRRAVQEFAHTVVNDSFVDQAQHSLYSMYGQSPTAEEEKQQEQAEDTLTSLMGDKDDSVEVSDAKVVEVKKPKKVSEQYWAQLIGFGSEKRAENFVKRVTSLGIPVILKKRVSKNNKGKSITWYQVVTSDYDSRQELDRIVSIVKRAENLKDILIKTKKR
ncbi:MAG TPA: SPOR domain-containing protein [Candidatus Babeliales bacterium]|nr:SPOR domain-containing protein [Candidatus Babeliales bacterium]